MAFLDWDDRMAVGHDVIDRQHRKLLGLINDIHDAAKGNAGKTVVSGFIKRLHEYSMVHFHDEECLMDHETYREYFTQVFEHTEFSLKVIGFHKRFIDDSEFDLGEMLEYVSDWFVAHTTVLDQTLREHLGKEKACVVEDKA